VVGPPSLPQAAFAKKFFRHVIKKIL